MNKVMEVNDNTLFDNTNKLLNGMVLNYTIPQVSLPFINQRDKEGISNLCKRANIKIENDELYDEEGNILDTNFIILSTVMDLTNISEVCKDKDDVSVMVMSLVKRILEDKVLSKISHRKMDDNISVEDLMSKLYGEGGYQDDKQNSYSR